MADRNTVLCMGECKDLMRRERDGCFDLRYGEAKFRKESSLRLTPNLVRPYGDDDWWGLARRSLDNVQCDELQFLGYNSSARH